MEREPFDLVLLDIKMPGTDGFEVLRQARPFCPMPIVALSGLRSIEDRERFVKLGGDGYITKPFDQEKLRFRIRIALKRKQEKADDIHAAAITSVEGASPIDRGPARQTPGFLHSCLTVTNARGMLTICSKRRLGESSKFRFTRRMVIHGPA